MTPSTQIKTDNSNNENMCVKIKFNVFLMDCENEEAIDPLEINCLLIHLREWAKRMLEQIVFEGHVINLCHSESDDYDDDDDK